LIGADLTTTVFDITLVNVAVVVVVVDVAATVADATIALADVVDLLVATSTRGFFAGGVGGSETAATELASMLLSDRFNDVPLVLLVTSAAHATNSLSAAAAT
jgi:hypothetical protein